MVEKVKLERNEKEDRIIRMMERKNTLLTKLMVKDLVLELVNDTSTQVMMGTCAKMLEEVLSEAMMRAEVQAIMQTLESVEGMEDRILQELSRNEIRRKKEARLAKKLEMESRWLSKRKEYSSDSDSDKVVESSSESVMMEWEEHDLEFMMASLGIEEEDLFKKE